MEDKYEQYKQYDERGNFETQLKLIVPAKMVVVLTITEINYLVVSLYFDLVTFFCQPEYICGIKFSGCVSCLVCSIATKAAMSSPTPFTLL